MTTNTFGDKAVGQIARTVQRVNSSPYGKQAQRRRSRRVASATSAGGVPAIPAIITSAVSGGVYTMRLYPEGFDNPAGESVTGVSMTSSIETIPNGTKTFTAPLDDIETAG